MQLATSTAGSTWATTPPSMGATDRGLAGRRLRARRRGLSLIGGLLAVTLAFTLLTGSGGAEAELEDAVAGHAVVEPGSTLWDVAVANLPEGEDPRGYLASIRALNGFSDAAVPAWTVVLLPAR